MPARSSSFASSPPPATGRSWSRAAAALPSEATAAGGDLHHARHGEPQSGRDAAQRARAGAPRARAPLRSAARARPRAGLERLSRRPHHRRAVPDHLVQGLPRAERVQAALQRRDGARRSRDRGQRPARRTDQRPLRHALEPHRGGAVEHRRRALRSGDGVARAHRRGAPRLGRRPTATASSWWSAACSAARAITWWCRRRAGSRRWD